MPNVTMLTQFSNIDEITAAIDGRWSKIAVLDFGTGHATNGYRLIQIFNGIFFDLDSRLELVLYYTVIFALGILCIEWWRKRAAATNQNPWLISILIAAILSSFVSAGSGGMEIGTFIGLATQIGIFSFAIRSRKSMSKLWNIAIISTLQLLSVFLWLGPYGTPFAAAWLVVYLTKKFKFSKVTVDESMLLAGTVSLLIAVAVWTVGVLQTTQPNTFAGSLSSQVQESPSYPIRYLLRMFPAGFMSEKTLEGLGPVTSYLLVYASSLFIFALLVIGLTKSAKSREIAPLPIFLITHGVFLALTLLINRPFGSNWLLSTWYGPQFKLLFCGIVLLWAANPLIDQKRKKFSPRFLDVLIILSIVSLTVFANARQLDRHPHERAFFQAVQEATINPNLLSLDDAGRTQLLLPIGESIRVINILNAYKLGVFSGGESVIPIDPSALSLSGDVWSDGWIGRQTSIRVGNKCQEVDMYFTSSVNNPKVNIQIEGDAIQEIVVEQNSPVRVKVGMDFYEKSRSIRILASPVWSPKVQGINNDLRELSVTMQSLCSKVEK